MLVAQPPYALTPTPFRFAALASLAGRAPLGGRREVVLAVYLAARLAQDVLPERDVAQASRAERASHARQWLSTLALPASIRPAIVTLIDASAGEPPALCRSLRATLAAVGDVLDRNAKAELSQLVTALDRL